MAKQDPAGELESVRTVAAASGIELDDDRAESLVRALARHRGEMEKLDRLDLEEREPGVPDPAAGR